MHDDLLQSTLQLQLMGRSSADILIPTNPSIKNNIHERKKL